MPKQNQAAQAKSEIRRKPKAEPAVAAEPTGDLAQLIGGPISVAAGGTIQAHAARLNDRQLQGAQRRALTAQIGRVQGNQHLQRVFASLTQDEEAANASPACQQSSGNQAVHRLLSSGVVQAKLSCDQLVQRKIKIATRGKPPWHEMMLAERASFLRRFSSRWRPMRWRNLARRVVQDMAATSDDLRFDSEAELATEVRKRVITSIFMLRSQRRVGKARAFGYPFRGKCCYWGPRVNYAARDYWEPRVSDRYSLRQSPAIRREIGRRDKDDDKAQVCDDPALPYVFRLSEKGKKNPYRALMSLFVPQPPHRRTLVHCDYLATLVHYRSFADSLKDTEFNRRVRDGTIPLVLTPLGYKDIQEGRAAVGAAHLQRVRLSSKRDLVIGDHVVFFNHNAYEPLCQMFGGVWKLENAILVDRRGGVNYFQGHGSGYRTEWGIRRVLLRHYNKKVRKALKVVKPADTRDPAKRERAIVRVERDYPYLNEKEGRWFIVGRGIGGGDVEQPLRELEIHEIPGLYNPLSYVNEGNPGTLSPVLRPVESK